MSNKINPIEPTLEFRWLKRRNGSKILQQKYTEKIYGEEVWVHPRNAPIGSHKTRLLKEIKEIWIDIPTIEV